MSATGGSMNNYDDLTDTASTSSALPDQQVDNCDGQGPGTSNVSRPTENERRQQSQNEVQQEAKSLETKSSGCKLEVELTSRERLSTGGGVAAARDSEAGATRASGQDRDVFEHFWNTVSTLSVFLISVCRLFIAFRQHNAREADYCDR